MRFGFFTKKLDDIHITELGGMTKGLCGKPFLGNDYYPKRKWKAFDNKPRKVCPECAEELVRRTNDIEARMETIRKALKEAMK